MNKLKEKNKILDTELYWYAFGLLSRTITGPALALIVAAKTSSIEQGIYYLFISVYSLVTIFEAGIGVVLSQRLAKFANRIEWVNKNSISGPINIKRYIHSAIALLIIWNLLVAIILLTLINIIGHIILGGKALTENWESAWYFYIFSSALLVIGGASVTINEGLLRRQTAYKIQLIGALLNAFAVCTSLLSGFGLFSLGTGALISGLFYTLTLITSLKGIIRSSINQLINITKYKRSILLVFKQSKRFVAKLAITWAGGYFYWNSFTLFSFIMIDPVIAGKVGLSMALARAGLAVAESGVQTKRVILTNFITNGKPDEAIKLFDAVFIRFWLLLVTGYGLFLLLLMIAPVNYSSKLLDPVNLAILFTAFAFLYYITGYATLLRSSNTEPLLFCSAFQNISTPLICYLALKASNLQLFLISMIVINLIAGIWVKMIHRNHFSSLLDQKN